MSGLLYKAVEPKHNMDVFRIISLKIRFMDGVVLAVGAASRVRLWHKEF